MAQKYITDAGTLIIPDAYVQTQVRASNSGLPTTGVIAIVGEASTGPRFSGEEDLEVTGSFGPNQEGAVVAKYTSGPLVDAFRIASDAANDAQIQGAPSRIILIKTNASTKASGAVAAQVGTYGTLFDKSYGANGNLIYWKVLAATAEAVPATGAFSFIPAVGTVDLAFRVNGGAALPVSLSANAQPSAAQAAIDGVAGVTATGGVDRGVLTISGTLLVDANPSAAGVTIIEVQRSVPFAATPVIGDTVVIPMGSVIAGAANANVGAYVVISVASSSVFRALKVSDAGKTGASIGVLTNPADVSPAVTIAATTDLQVFSPIAISLDPAAVINGAGKSLAVLQLATGTDLLERTAFLLGTSTAVSWISKTSAPKLLNSASEYRANLHVTRQSDGVDEALLAGGEIAMKIGYQGTSGTVTITDTTLTTSVVGGSGGNLSVPLANFPTIADLCTFINSQAGYTANAGTAVLGLLPSSALDNVSAVGIANTFGEQAGRIKIDAYRFFRKVTEESVLVQFNNPVAQADSGLPVVTSAIAYLSGGAKGGTSDADVLAALTALKNVGCNFVVTAMSRDAAQDIADALTDSTSTYTIDSINANLRSHILAMGKLKAKKNRIGFASVRRTFNDAKEAAANQASPSVLMTFQDFKTTNSNGVLTQFHPWAGACFAAGMQAAGFYRNILGKGINCTGVLSFDKSFDYRDTDQVEEALLAGLLIAKRADGGGFTWVSDQTTYGKDENFVFNSLQAMYALNTIALGTAQRMGKAFIGQSVADISAPVALSFLEGIMDDWLRLKLIAPSDGGLKGWRNAKIAIDGGVMVVEIEIFLAGSIYFIPIKFQVSPVKQTAGA